MKVMENVKKILAGGLVAGCFLVVSTTTLTGCLTDDKKDTVTKVDPAKHTPLNAEAMLSVGAQGHASLGTAVDLDNKTVMLSAAANAALGTIDVLFAYSGAEFKLITPIAAKAAGDIGVAANYVSADLKVTEFVKVSAKPLDSEAAAKAFTDGTKSTSMKIAEGDMFVVKTGMGKIVYLKIKSIAGAEKAAAADLTLAISAL